MTEKEWQEHAAENCPYDHQLQPEMWAAWIRREGQKLLSRSVDTFIVNVLVSHVNLPTKEADR